MAAVSESAGPAAVERLAPGRLVSERFRVRDARVEGPLGVWYDAHDERTGARVALRVLPRALFPHPSHLERLRRELRAASEHAHRALRAIYAAGATTEGSPWIAEEPIDGLTLGAILARRGAHRPLSLRGAYNVVAHVASAMGPAHPAVPHGGLRPDVIWVSRAGRVKVDELGLARAVLALVGADALGPGQAAFVAPEVRDGAAPTAASDVYGLGATLFAMLTGQTPLEGASPPSRVHPHASADVDALVTACLAVDPARRPPSLEHVRRTLRALAVAAPAVPSDADFGIEIDVDTDPTTALETVRAPRPPAPVEALVPRAPAAPTAETVGGPPPPRLVPEDIVMDVDLNAALERLTRNDSHRWMVVKDGLDHGPFSGRELVELVAKGEVRSTHGLLDTHTGERRRVADHPDLGAFAAEYDRRHRADRERAALDHAERRRLRFGVAQLAVAGLVLIGLVGGGVAFLASRDSAGRQARASDDLASLYEAGEIEIVGSAGILPEPAPRRGGPRRPGGPGGAPPGAYGSYEDAMNRAVSLGDATKAGGETRLGSGEVAGVMNRQINRLYACVSEELRRGGSLSQVQIDLAIAGSGEVLGASVRQGSPAFQSCIASRVRSIRFPTFAAPRMGARYSFAVD